MDPESRTRRRGRFDIHVDSYEIARSGYPAPLISELGKLCGLAPTSRVLEIGCGPGTLTKDLAPFGCEIVALELGERLAEAARRSLAPYPRVHVVTSSFEDWPLPPGQFDLVVAAGSYHWLDPTVRLTLIFEALAQGGRVAILNRHRLMSENQGIEEDIRSCYLRWDPKADSEFRHPTATEVNAEIEDLRSDRRFTAHVTRRYLADEAFTSSRYRHLLNTYSDFTLLNADSQRGLADCLCSVIDSKAGGTFVMPLLATFHVAQTSVL